MRTTHRSGRRVADEALTAGAVARRLGVAVTTLRTWHQRYGLGPSHHVPGQHRRYTAEDMERLQVMRRLTGQGVAPAEAAAWARRVPVPMDVATPGPRPAIDIAWPRPDMPVTVARDGGGHAIPIGRAGPAARGLARAAMRLDAPAQRDILEMTIANHGVVTAWEQVIMPVLIGIGERYQSTQRFIEVEHLTSRTVTEVFGSVPRPSSDQMPHILLAAADEEQHTLPLEALAAALAEAGVPSRLLGARVPPQALGDAMARTGPAAVVVWSQMPETGDPEQVRRLLSGPHPPLVVAAAGPGWSQRDLPTGVPLLGNLTDAIRIVAAAAADTRQAG
jgi:MerR family transcriptional regulator, light-induced transcriptional regulator